MRYYPLSVTGEILDIVIHKGLDQYYPNIDNSVPADGSNFSIAVRVVYHGEATSGGRVVGYVYTPPPVVTQYDDDPDHWPYDDPETEHVYYIDFGPINKEGPWSALIVYTRVISGVETTLKAWAGYLFTAGPVMPPADVSNLVVTSYSRR